MNKTILAGGAALVIAAAAWLALGRPEAGEQAEAPPPPAPGEAMVQVTLPDRFEAEAQRGKRAFDAICAACHGADGAGKMGSGPPLVHKIYEPSHHGDMAFYMAVQQGVRAHHWRFGDMPPQPGLTRGDVAGIVAYIRSLQRANGIN